MSGETHFSSNQILEINVNQILKIVLFMIIVRHHYVCIWSTVWMIPNDNIRSIFRSANQLLNHYMKGKVPMEHIIVEVFVIFFAAFCIPKLMIPNCLKNEFDFFWLTINCRFPIIYVEPLEFAIKAWFTYRLKNRPFNFCCLRNYGKKHVS